LLLLVVVVVVLLLLQLLSVVVVVLLRCCRRCERDSRDVLIVLAQWRSASHASIYLATCAGIAQIYQ